MKWLVVLVSFLTHYCSRVVMYLLKMERVGSSDYCNFWFRLVMALGSGVQGHVGLFYTLFVE